MHVGIDTVGLQGEGFEALVNVGDRVRSGTPLLRFDLELLARRAASLLTPVIIVNAGYSLTWSAAGAPFDAGSACSRCKPTAHGHRHAATAAINTIAIYCDPGGRGPGARAARSSGGPYRGSDAGERRSVTIECNGRTSDARSVTELMMPVPATATK